MRLFPCLCRLGVGDLRAPRDQDGVLLPVCDTLPRADVTCRLGAVHGEPSRDRTHHRGLHHHALLCTSLLLLSQLPCSLPSPLCLHLLAVSLFPSWLLPDCCYVRLFILCLCPCLQVEDGPCPSSFGIHVAELAAFPPSVVEVTKRRPCRVVHVNSVCIHVTVCFLHRACESFMSNVCHAVIVVTLPLCECRRRVRRRLSSRS